MLDRVVWESRHKFGYFDDDKINMFLDSSLKYPAKLDCEEPIVVLVKDSGLPQYNKDLELDKYRIYSFHNSYYEFLIALNIVDTLVKNIDKDELNNRLKHVLRLYSSFSSEEINNVDDLRTVLEDSMNIYRDGYIEYINIGNCNFFHKLKLSLVMIDNFVMDIKKCIGLEKYFSFMYIPNNKLSKECEMAINNYIGSRCNGYLSMCILCGNSEWDYYYDVNGQIIQGTHDYTEIMDYDYSKRKRIRHN